MNRDYPPGGTRWLITISVMAASLMISLDTTIANVALPHIQGSVSASADEISWMLTSYIVASAIITPLTGWLVAHVGRKHIMLYSIGGFTMASGLCGFSTNLYELVAFRLLQGALGATLVPLSQATLLDINPPERHGQAMATWSMGVILGPVIGPVLGGWLTDTFSWRWVFFINLPVGALAILGLSASLSNSRDKRPAGLDFFGFAVLSLAITSLQLFLDRGPTKGWFDSPEICVEVAATLFFGYLTAVHTLTAKRPFVNIALFSNRNFVIGSGLGFFVGPILFGVLALLPPMLENLLGYPVTFAGIVMAPRGIGTLLAMTLMGRLLKYIDARLFIFVGFVTTGWAMHRMSGFSLDMDQSLIVSSGFIQGVGIGMVYVALTTASFATLDSRYRNDGTAMYSLIRNIGSSAGISVLEAMTVHNATTVHARLSEGFRAGNPIMSDFYYTLPAAVGSLNAEITRQAAMVSYIDVFWALCLMSIAVTPMLLFMRAAPNPAQKAQPRSHKD